MNMIDQMVDETINEINKLKIQKDNVYRERNELVAFLSTCYPSYLCRHPEDDIDWEDDWRWIVCIKTSEGQMTWHIHDLDLPLFTHLFPKDDHQWDGHTTEEKYKRLRRIINNKVIRGNI